MDEQPESTTPPNAPANPAADASQPNPPPAQTQTAAHAAAMAAIDQAKTAQSGTAAPSAVNLPSFSISDANRPPEGIDLLADVNLQVKIELGRTRMLVEDVLRLGEGSVVELDKLAGDPVDVYVNDRHVARGEVLVLNDNFCVRINEIVAQAGEEAA